MGQVFPTCRVVQSGSSTRYLNVFGEEYETSNLDEIRVPMSVEGIITKLLIKKPTAPGEGTSFRYRVYINTTAAIDVTISDAETEKIGRGLGLVSPGDRVYIKVDPTNSPYGGYSDMSLVFWTATDDESSISGSIDRIYPNQYIHLMGWNATGGDVDEIKREFIAAESCTLSDLRVIIDIAPGTGKSHTLTVRKNEQDTSLAVTISNLGHSGANTEDSVAVAAGDRISVKCTQSVGATVTDGACSVKVVRASNEFLVGGANSYSVVFDGDYAPAIGVAHSLPASQRYKALIACDVTFKALYVKLATAPGAGNSRVVALMKYSGSETETALKVTISNAETTKSVETPVAFSEGDLFYLEWSETGTPDATAAATFGLLASVDFTGPTVTTDKILEGVATGTVSAIGDGSSCSVRGFCYKEATSGDPNVFDDSIVVSGGDEHVDGEFATGEYSLDLSLEAGKLYRVRAFAVNDNALSYATTLAAYHEYPSDAMARVSAIRRIFRPGLYRMEIALGDLGFEWDVAEAAMKKTDEGVGEPEKPEEPPKPELKYPPDEVFVPDWMKPEVSTWDRYRALLEGTKDEQFVSLRPITDTPKVVEAVDVAKEVIGGIGMFISYVTHPGALVTDMIRKLIGWFK